MRAAADELRAELAGDRVTFVVNRNINFTNVCVVGCAFCGFGQGSRSPDAYHVAEDDFQARVGRRSSSAPPRSACRAGSTPTTRSSTTGAGCGWPRRSRRRSTCTPTRRWRSTSCASAPGKSPRGGVRLPARVRARLDAGHGRRGPGRRRPHADLARTSCRPRAGSRSSRPATASGLRSTSTVMFGHIEEPWELARHMRVVRELQERTGGITEFVPLSLHPLQHPARPHPRGRGDLPRGEPQAHRGLPAGARQDDPQPPGELGEDGPRRRHREPALGGQRPRRHADGGEHLPDGGLPARRSPRPARADRAPRARPAASPPSARPCTRSSRR